MLVWQAHKGKIESIAFAPDGGLLATATGGTSTAHLWEPTTGKLALRLTGDWPDSRGLGHVKSVAFAPAAPLFAAGTSRRVTVWRTDTWEVIGDHITEYAYELAFGPGETPMLAASGANYIAIWDDAGRPTGNRMRPWDRRIYPKGGVSSLDFTADGRLLATISCRNAGVWNPATGEPAEGLQLFRPPGNHRGCVRFSPDGLRLAVARGKVVDIWNIPVVRTPADLTITAGTGRQPAVWALGWAADGKVLMTAGADGFVRFWDAAAGKELRSFAWGIGKVYCAAFSPDGLTCAAGGDKGQIVVWDVDE